MKRFLETGNFAIAEGAILAGCRFFGGYPITPATEIAEAIQIDLPAVSALLGRMEKSNLVNRRPSPRNRREVLVFLTEEGYQMREDINGRMGQIRGRLMEQVTQTDMADLQDLVGRIKKLIQK